MLPGVPVNWVLGPLMVLIVALFWLLVFVECSGMRLTAEEVRREIETGRAWYLFNWWARALLVWKKGTWIQEAVPEDYDGNRKEFFVKVFLGQAIVLEWRWAFRRLPHD